MSTIESWEDPRHPDFDPMDPRWVALTRDERMVRARASDAIELAERGWGAIGVFPTGGGSIFYHFAYTFGGGTSVIVTGLSAGAQGLLEMGMANLDRPDGEPWDPTGDGEMLVFAPVPEEAFREHCTRACEAGDSTARQLIWTDDEGRWPWDAGHLRLTHRAETGLDTMPILAGNDWRPA